MRNIRIKALLGTVAAMILFGIVVSCGGGGGDSAPAPTPTPTPTPTPAPIIIRSAALTGAQEAPTPVNTTAIGSGAVIVTRSTGEISGGVNFTGITPTVAHIHMAAAGVAGPIIITLVVSPDGTATVPQNAILDATQLAALEAGNLYFNVHSNAFPDGEIRGQITGTANLRAGTAILDGAAERPTPVNTTATGRGTLVFDSSTGQIHTSYVTHNVGSTTSAAHIHSGAATVAGPIEVTFTHGPNLATAPAGSTLTAQNRTNFANGALYFNVHSAANPNGEIRGQISIVQ